MPNGNRQNIADELIRRGQQALEAERGLVPFTGEQEVDEILNNIEEYPHVFVLGCISDRQMRTRGAWFAAHTFCRNVVPGGDLAFRNIYNNIRGLQEALEVNHRYPNVMRENFHFAINHIQTRYEGSAGSIWGKNPMGATVVRRFLGFAGVGLKIANMAANILLRDFNVAIRERCTIDIPVDSNVMRVFKRLGLVPQATLKKEVVMYAARELYPDYPAVFDAPVWEIGDRWCHARGNPNCAECYMCQYCPVAAPE